MTRSRFASIVAIACVAVATASACIGHAVSAIAYTFQAGWDYVLGRVPIAPADTKSETSARPRVALVKARSFVARLMRRERPRVTPLWRMCPSI